MAGSRSALIVATYRYEDARLKMLQAPERDAEALAEVLGDPGIGGFEVKTVVNEGAQQIRLALAEFFAQRRADDVLLVHFSCHGVKDDSGELFLAATDTRMNLLDATAVPSAYVNKMMNQGRAGCVVLLLDCCYAGAFARGITRAAGDVDVTDRFGGRGRAVITASTALQYAFEGDRPSATGDLGAPSVFTRALVEGLRSGEADRDSDGIVSLDELYAHVHDEVSRVNPDQTPQKWLFDVAGDLYVARRATPVTVPSKLPAELEGTMHSLLAWERESAIGPLRELLAGTHPGRALAARLALERLAGKKTEDSTRVRKAARAALAAAPVATPAPEPESPPEHELTPTPTPPDPVEEAAPPSATDGPVLTEPIVVDPGPEEPVRAESGAEEGPPTTVLEPEEEAPGSDESAAAERRRKRRRLLGASSAAAVVLALAGAYVVTRGGGRETALPESTLLLTEGDRLMKYDVDTGKGSPLPLEHVKNPTISEDRQWFSYLEWPPGTTGAAASVPGIAKVSDLTQHHALPGTGPGTDCETSNRATWSPDGQRLAMVCPAQPGVPAHLLVMDRDGDNRVDAADDVCCGLTWIDDHTIVVGRKTSSGSELGEVSADGDGQWEPEVSGGGFFHDPDWSDGGLVYVHSEHSPNQSGEIRVASSLSAADVENATVWSSSGDFPAWDPSGTRLAYLKTDSRTRKDAVYQLYIAAGPYRGVLAEIEPGALGAPAWGSR